MDDIGLRQTDTESLKKMLRALHRDELPCPLTPTGLACIGLQDQAGNLLSHLRGLDHAGVRAVVVAVLAERLAADPSQAPG